MNRNKVTQKNFNKVMDEIKAMYKRQSWDRPYWVEAVEQMLNDLQGEDFFGTEGQNDPRGDQRD